MPHSLVLNIVPLSPIKPGYLSGRHLHALFFSLVSSVDRDLGQYLHDQKTDKAFTVSNLQVVNRRNKGNDTNDTILQWQHAQPIPAGTSCWWRVSLLDDTLFSKLTPLWLNLNPDHPWHLGNADLHITSILATPQPQQPWANFCPYDQLYDRASDSDRLLSFVFCTPTLFRQGEYDSALPTKECVFNSLIKRWHQYSNIPLLPSLTEAIFPSYFNIHTEIVTQGSSKAIGCVGEITYRILGDIEPIKIKQINALADFAMYCGIGRKTPMGMGMVRRVY